MKQLWTLSIFMLFTGIISAQTIDRCHQEQWLEQMIEQDPNYQIKIEKGFADFNSGKLKPTHNRAFVTLPVHVIIVHPPGQPEGTGQNLSLEHVMSQIDVLNQDFGQYNSDSGNTPAQFPAGDTGIQFCLATVDPDGNATDGITRYPFSGNFDANASSIRSETRWPRDNYINIWVAPNLPYLGLASVPSTGGLPPANNDFIHVTTGSFGGPGYATLAPYDLGRTTTHEMGHYLGLFHIWASNGCSNDDGISDTPVQDNENFGCPSHPSPSCSNSGDMFMNYMDYVNDNCMNAFTVGQGNYMNTILSTSRATLPGSSSFACVEVVPLELTVLSQSDPLCANADNGTILVEASGGTPNYSYSINGSAFSSNSLFTDLGPGTYVIEVVDADGNSDSVIVSLGSPNPLGAIIDITQENNCPNDENGAVVINPTGGSNPYMFSLNGGTSQNSNAFNNLPTGFYNLLVTDNNGCTYEEVFEIASVNDLSLSIDSTANLICSNDNMGYILASATGGEGNIMFSIDGIDFQESGEFTELDGGEYTIIVADDSGCFDIEIVEISEPSPFFASVSTTDVSCFGLSDGSVNVDAVGGTPGYLYSFDSINYSTVSSLDSLPAGDYSVYIIDTLGCMTSADFPINQPDEIIINLDSMVMPMCFGDEDGELYFSAEGGEGVFNYTLDSMTNATGIFTNLLAGNYTVMVTDSSGCMATADFILETNSAIEVSATITNPSCDGAMDGSVNIEVQNTQGTVSYSLVGGPTQDNPLFDNLAEGDYTFIVSDDSGCQAAYSTTLIAPEPLIADFLTSDVSCFGDADGFVQITVSGGTAPYTYSLMVDNDQISNLEAGTYAIEIMDSNGCMLIESFTIDSPEPIGISTDIVTMAACDGTSAGSISAQGTGGNGGYEYALNGVSNADGVFDNVPYGVNTISIVDSEGCNTSEDFIMPYMGNVYAEITSIEDILCNEDGIGGALTILTFGDNLAYSYSIDGNPVDPNNLMLAPGSYDLVVTHDNGCEIILPFEIMLPDPIFANYFFQNGELSISTSGGTKPFEYSNDGGNSYTTDSIFVGEFGESVNIVVKDRNGCTFEIGDVVLSSNDIFENVEVFAAPNPFTSDLNLYFNLKQETELNLTIFDINGRLVKNILSKKYVSGENFVKIDASNFESSIYIVKIASANGSRFIKVTKM